VDKVISESNRKQRAFKGLSQENVAEELGMSTANYGKIERGEQSHPECKDFFARSAPLR
jgi:transcriptional regulator with XRE-family HTH domain